MTWKTLTTRLSGASAEAPCMVMSREGHAHCVWIEDDELKYARCRGQEWEYVGETATIASGEDDLKISYRCVSSELDDLTVVYMDGNSLLSLSWNGFAWTEAIVSTGETNLLGWALDKYDGGTYLVLLRGGPSAAFLTVMEYESGSWTEKGAETQLKQQVDEPQLVIRFLDRKIYTFWRNSIGDIKTVGRPQYRGLRMPPTSPIS